MRRVKERCLSFEFPPGGRVPQCHGWAAASTSVGARPERSCIQEQGRSIPELCERFLWAVGAGGTLPGDSLQQEAELNEFIERLTATHKHQLSEKEKECKSKDSGCTRRPLMVFEGDLPILHVTLEKAGPAPSLCRKMRHRRFFAL